MKAESLAYPTMFINTAAADEVAGAQRAKELAC